MRKEDINTPVFWLQNAGYSAYLVGNQVRDKILKVESDRADVDIATNARPNHVAKTLQRNNIIPTIIDEKFGVVSFTHNQIKFEITTFRQDIYRQDFELVRRYPDEIRFVSVAAQDASRRDLTINAIYLNPKTGKYLDYYGGLADLENKIIRLIGDPKVRLQEDPIRILRAIRFKHLLGFKYDKPTWSAISKSGDLLKKVSPNVVKKELQKLQSIANYHAARADLVKLGIVRIA
jgi:tRNA nucleotidyltransferase/poly(A) polymerase